MIAPADIVKATEAWLDTIVIGHNFCPFAQYVRDNQQVHISVCESDDLQTVLEHFAEQVIWLHKSTQASTALIVCPNGFHDFDYYLMLVDWANRWLKNNSFEGIYQLASFHPDYLFEGEDPNSPSHYTNRAPYPTIHLIDEADMEKALSHYPHDPESIPERNIEHACELGNEYFQRAMDSFTK